MTDDLIILDGGMGQELLARTDAPPTQLWSAAVMDADPDLVVEVHRDYLDAGADVITINAFSATRCRLGPRGRESDYERLQQLALDLAGRARREAGREDDALIAGCLAPYAWAYRPDLAPSFHDLVPGFTETAALQAPGVDLLLCETMASAREGAAAAVAAATTGLPVWVAWTVEDHPTGLLRSGETLREAVEAVTGRGVAPAALLVNCSVPEAIDAAVGELVALADELGVPAGAYANGFGPIIETYSTSSTVEELPRRHDLDPDGHLTWIRRWHAAGLSILGGCCEIGPAHIRRMTDDLRPGRSGAQG
ncbi:MAG: homocysteine S-methyltransferase family protein [Actinomycetota bacterium]